MSHLVIKPPTGQENNQHFLRGWFNSFWAFQRKDTDLDPVKTATFYIKDVFFYPVDTTSGAITGTLPLCLGNRGRQVVVKKTAGANNVTVAASGSDTVDGAASVVIATAGDSVWLICDGISKWYKIKTI